MEDFPPPWEGDERSRGRKRRLKDDHRREFSDDGWGMAFDADMYDGDEADIEDWAAGMVHEEGRGDYDFYEPRDRDDARDPERNQAGKSRNPQSIKVSSRGGQRPRDPRKPSPAIERAAEFMERVEGRPRKHSGRMGDRSRNSLRTSKAEPRQMTRRGDYVDMPSRLHSVRGMSRNVDQGCLATLFGFELDTNNLPMMAAMALIFVCILAFFALMVFVILSGVL